MKRDPSLDFLLDLDGQILVLDPEARHWVRFVVRRVPVSTDRPHGIQYSLTLHAANGRRLVGFDNAHRSRTRQGPGGKSGSTFDHMHLFNRVQLYQYRDAAALVADF